MSFTDEIGSSEVSLISLRSPMIHWLSAENTAFNSAVLQVSQCRGSHPSELIKTPIIKKKKDGGWEMVDSVVEIACILFIFRLIFISNNETNLLLKVYRNCT